MLLVDVREVLQGPVEVAAALPPDDGVFEGLDLQLVGPLAVDGRLQATGDGEFFWRGNLRGVVRGECRRCLAEVTAPVEAEVEALFSADPEALDDPSVYPLAPHAARIDVGQAVREELVLAAPAWMLCRDDCAGLCPRCGSDLNAGPCGCTPAQQP
ncbi:MAG: DUF177 domain-containing protein [Gemmatimonadales bacterium]|nr:DUF177 domain-containing protein [Gemmatimonadales bacterium]